MSRFRPHPISEIFPAMEGAEFDALVEDIKAHGLQQKLVMYQGKILDGRNRWRACEALGIKPKWVDYEGDDPLGHVLSLNLHRRHLDASQRAMVAARMATLKLGANQHTKEGAQICAPSQDEAAEKMTVSRRGVQSARAVVEHGTPALAAAVDRREVAVSVAGKIATAPKRVQREAVKNHGKNAPAIAKRIEEEKREEKPKGPPIDPRGLEVPADVLAEAATAQELVDKMGRLLAELKSTYTEYEALRGEREGLESGQYHANAIRETLNTLNLIRGLRPVSVCLQCKLVPEVRGKGTEYKCGACGGRGYIGKEMLKTMGEPLNNQLFIEGDDAGVFWKGYDGKGKPVWRTLTSLRGEDFE